jgi:hypothetical protein
MPNWVFNLNLVKYSPIVQFDEQRISNRAFFRIVVLLTEAVVLDAMDLSTE